MEISFTPSGLGTGSLPVPEPNTDVGREPRRKSVPTTRSGPVTSPTSLDIFSEDEVCRRTVTGSLNGRRRRGRTASPVKGRSSSPETTLVSHSLGPRPSGPPTV